MKNIQLLVFGVVLGLYSRTPALAQRTNEAYFQKIRTERVSSDSSVQWKNFGPGMSGYCEEFWCHPTDSSVMFMGPDMHVSFGTWDKGESWQTIKDSDGLGLELKRVLDIDFSLQDADYGMAIDWNGWAYETVDRGRSWNKINELGTTHDGAGAAKPRLIEQRGARLSELAVDPNNDNVWYAGAGDFWNVKENHKSASNPNGIPFKYADYGYVLKSTDKGRTWKKSRKGLPENTDVAKIVIDPKHSDRIIMATNCGMFVSDDGGQSWTSSASGLPNNLPRDLTSYYNSQTGEFVLYLVEQTVYEPKNKTVASKGGVYQSTDGGASWVDITGNLSIDLNRINFPATSDGFHRTIAYWFGITKKESRKKFPKLPGQVLPVFNRIAVSPLNKDEIYLSCNKKHDYSFGSGDLWRTIDGGKNWIACARNGQYWMKGKDKSYWQERGNPVGANVEFSHLQRHMDEEPERSGNRMMAINPNGDVFIGIDQQTLMSSDKGKSWQQIDDFETSPGSNKWIGRGDSNLPGRFMLHETGIPNRRLLCSGEHGLWQTTDLGGWHDSRAVAVEQIEGQNHPHGAHSISTVAVHPKDPKTLFFLAWRQEHRGKLRKTTDGGKTWKNIATIFEAENSSWEGVAPQNSLMIDPVSPNFMYFCSTYLSISEVGNGKGPKLTKGGYGFYRSHDGGNNWELSNKGFHKGASVRRVVMYPGNPKVMFAALNDNNGGLFLTRNRGTTWKRFKIPSQIKSVNNVFIDRNTKHIYLSAGQRDGTLKEGGVWRSENHGKSWQQIFEAPYVWQAETSPVNPNLIVISVAGQRISVEQPFMNPGVYLSLNAGQTWKKINRGLGQPDKIVDVKPDPTNENVLWCASWGCGWFVAFLSDSTTGWMKK